MINIKQELEQKGFAHIPAAFCPEEIGELVKATESSLKNSDFEYDFLTMNKDKHIHKVRYMFEKDDVFRKALVHDSIFSIVSQLVDPASEIVPTWEDMLVKVPFKGIPVGVHQDLALQSVGSDVFSLGVYLHDSGTNPVYYLPGSYKMGPLTRDDIHKVYNEQKSNFVPVRAKAGDIIIHNVKTVHYSEENLTPNPRYTWYLEFRSKKQLLEDSPWDKEWMLQRRAIWVSALEKYRHVDPELIPNREELAPYLAHLNLRVSHTDDKIQYDMKSPYNHFSDE